MEQQHNDTLPGHATDAPVRPLRVLFMACAPQDQEPFDFEREEESLLRAVVCAGSGVAGPGPAAAVESCDLGTFEELRQRIAGFRPHVVHLAGRAGVRDDGLGYFAFEDERGQGDPRPGLEMARELFGAASGVQCVLVSGRGEAAATAGAELCQGLLAGGVPLVIGWAVSLVGPSAARFAAVFYNALAAGEPAAAALLQARGTVLEASGGDGAGAGDAGGDGAGEAPWPLPVLYGASAQGLTLDPGPDRGPDSAPSGLAGRRREQQRLLPALRDGQVQVALITGADGAGKTALAARLARRLQADGFMPIALQSTPTTPLDAATLFQACGDAFLAAGLRHVHAALRDASLPVEGRMRHLISALNDGRFVLVLDGFEASLDQATRRIADPELAWFYGHLLHGLSGGSRAIITARSLPSDVENLPPAAREETLGALGEAAFIASLLRDDGVRRRLAAGDPPPELLGEVHRLLGGAPCFLDQARAVLKTASGDELRQQLRAPGPPAGAGLDVEGAGAAGAAFAALLYDQLDPGSRRALSCAAVYGVAVDIAALAAVAGEAEDRLREFALRWHERALAYAAHHAREARPAARGAQEGAQEGLREGAQEGLREGAQEGAQDGAAPELWAVCGHLRPWLLAEERLSLDERRAAHRAAGDFLRDLEARDGEGELGLSWLGCLLEARAQYLAAGGFEPALAVTDRISAALVRQGEYGAVERLNRDLLGHAEHAAPMSWIGRAHLERGDYDDARRSYERCLDLARGRMPCEEAVAWHGLAAIDFRQRDLVGAEAKLVKLLELEQRAGNRAGEAAAWHQLAVIDGLQKRSSASRRKFQKSLDVARDAGDRAGEAAAHCALAEIDVKRGDLAGAREKFERSLVIVRETGNRTGEALTWAQAGITVGKRGRHEDGLRLLLLAAMQLESIGHADLRRALTWINGIVLHLKWAQAQLDALAREVAAAFEKDSGRGMMDAAFRRG